MSARRGTADGRKAPWYLLGVVAALALLPACGVPIDSTANTIAGIAAPPTPLSVAAPPGSHGNIPAEIFYVQNNRLTPTLRHVSKLTPMTLLGLLIEAPTKTEAADGIVNALSPGHSIGLANPSAKSGVLTVQLPSEIISLEGSQLYEAYGEIVYTLLDQTNNHNCALTGIAFTLDGQPWPAFLPSFVVSPKPYVTERDYVGIAPSGTSKKKTC